MISYRGRTIPILSHEPDWRDKISCTEEYSTITREALDTSEERLSRRHRSRFKLDFSISCMSGDETTFLRSVLESASDRPFGVPLWQDYVLTTAAALEEQPWLDVEDCSAGLFDVCDYVIVWSSYRTFSVLRRFSVTANQIILADPLDAAYAVGVRVAPLAVGKLDISDMTGVTDLHATFKARFEEAFLTDEPMVCQLIEGVDVEATYFFESECVGGSPV